MLEKYYLFFLLALISEVIGTISGFGSSIIFVPVASLFFDFRTVLGITAVFHVFSNLSKIAMFYKAINWQIAIRLGIPAILFVILGAWLTAYLPARQMELFMSITLILLSVYLLFNKQAKIRPSNRNLYMGGTLSGFLAGLVGTGGAIRGITLAAFHLPKDIFIATSALIDLGVDSSRAIVYISNGYFQKELRILIPFLIGISVLGTYTGKQILKYTSERIFRYFVLITIILTSIIQLVNYLRS